MISAFLSKNISYNAMGLLFLMKNSTILASTLMKCRIDNSLSSSTGTIILVGIIALAFSIVGAIMYYYK